MPEGPLGFARFTTLGPLSRENEEDLREKWESCEKNTRDQTDVEICRIIKEWAVGLIVDQSIRPEVKKLEDINEGFCFFVTEAVIEELDGGDVTILNDGRMGFNHCWIEYRGRHFDAEAPTGVDDPSELPAFKKRGIDVTGEFTTEMEPHLSGLGADARQRMREES